MAKQRPGQKITEHAVSRFLRQTNFRGTEYDAERLLVACSRMMKKWRECSITIRSCNLPDISNEELKSWGIVEGVWFVAGETDGTIVTVKKMPEYISKKR